MYQYLLTPLSIKRAQIAGYCRPSEADDAQELVVDWIGDGDSVGKLICCIDAVVMADRYIWRGTCLINTLHLMLDNNKNMQSIYASKDEILCRSSLPSCT